MLQCKKTPQRVRISLRRSKYLMQASAANSLTSIERGSPQVCTRTDISRRLQVELVAVVAHKGRGLMALMALGAVDVAQVVVVRVLVELGGFLHARVSF